MKERNYGASPGGGISSGGVVYGSSSGIISGSAGSTGSSGSSPGISCGVCFDGAGTSGEGICFFFWGAILVRFTPHTNIPEYL